jgi:uncharacterized protein (TIGR02266 family)
MSVDRREFPRFSTSFDVRFRRREDAARALRAFSVNFSPGGLCLRTRAPHAVGEDLKLAVAIEGERFVLEGVVAWVRGEAIGVRFVNVGPHERQRLDSVARGLVARHAPIASEF